MSKPKKPCDRCGTEQTVASVQMTHTKDGLTRGYSMRLCEECWASFGLWFGPGPKKDGVK